MDKTQIMGVINVTPDSFYDGGALADAAAVRARGEEMARDGADWIDTGGESSRPGAAPVGEEEELRRIIPALEALSDCGVPRSVDTYRAVTARRALALGASMINDITACQADPEMAEVVAESGCLCVLMHMRGQPEHMQDAPRYNDVVDDIRAFFDERIAAVTRAGVRESQLWLDPGFGFGKTVEHNLEILRRLDAFQCFGLPVLLGTSNKSAIGAVLGGLPPEQRSEGTAATVALAIGKGVDCVRVHDVKGMARVARMADAVVRGWQMVPA